ncbi:MAG: hypothetical protein Q8O13_01350 [Candidatus Omnitrophota bacterium]|nr:hypothetical protein [Candidatus Omnitrophota bacterium]
MFKHLKIIVVLSLVFGFTLSSAFAREHAHKHTQAITSATPQLGPGEVVITGRVICLGCHLKKEKQAKAQCSIYGHTNALSIEKIIDAQGKSIDKLKGKIYQFLRNEKSDELIKDHTYAGKVIIVVGKIYPEANILEINFFKEKEGE